MSDFGVTDDGFERKDEVEIREDLLEDGRSEFGSDHSLQPRSVVGIILRAVVQVFEFVWNVMESIYFSRYVRTAEGQSLDLAVDDVGIDREPAVKSEGIVTITGTAGATVPENIEVGNTDDASHPVYLTTESTTVQSRGEVDVRVEAKEAGAQGNVGAGSINGLLQPVTDIDGADNNYRSNTLGIGDSNATLNRTMVTPSDTNVYQTVDVSDVLHEIRINEVRVTVNNPESSTQNYVLDFRWKDDANGEVVHEYQTQRLNIDSAGDQTITLGEIVDLRGVGKARLEVDVDSRSDADLEIVASTNDDYGNGAFFFGGAEQTGEDWLIEIDNETLGATEGGADVESDEELQRRYFDSLGATGSSTVDAILANVLAVDGVRQATIEENDTNSTVNGLPPHSIEVTALGGADDDVGAAVFSKAAGIRTSGGVTVTILDNLENERDVSFSRPTIQDIEVSTTVTVNGNFPADGRDRIRDAIIDYIGGTNTDNQVVSGTGIGEDVVYTQVLGAITSVQGVVDTTTNIGPKGGTLDQDNISIASGDVAEISVGDISITVQ